MLPLLPGAATYAAGDTFESLVQREAAALAAAAANADRCPLGAIGDVAPGLPPGGALALPRALFRARAIVFDAAMLRGGLRLGGATGAMLHRKCFVHIAKFELELELVVSVCVFALLQVSAC